MSPTPRRAALAALTPMALTLVCACGAAPRPFVPERAGPPAEHSVVYLSSSCSGVLIAPDRVLTAAHCVEDEGPWTARVDGARGREERAAIACEVHPDAYEGEARACGQGRAPLRRMHDLAVLTLERGIEGAAPLPVVLVEPSLDDDWWRGRDLELFGWDRRPFMIGALVRRGGPNRIVSLRREGVLTEPREAEGFRTRMGDSGGPALLEWGGERRVIGVLFGGPDPSSSRSIYTATYEPVNARWLLEQLGVEWARDLPDAAETASNAADVTGAPFPR